MHRLIRMVANAAASLVLMGCAERVNAPTAARVPAAPSFEIRDGAHNNGNPHFYFLPPIVASPNATGSFDATQAPSVTVCQLASSGCPVIAQFSMTTGTGSAVVRVDAASQSYVVNWQTEQCVTGPCTLPSGNVYRIRVLVAGTELGRADIQVVASQQEAKNVNTGEFFPLVDGRTLPVKFRIEQGAVFVVAPSTQRVMIQTPVTDAGSSVQLVIPAGALSQPAALTVLPAMLPSGTSTSALVGGTAYDFGPTGTMFASPVAVMMQYSPAQLPGGMAESTLRLFTLMNGRWFLVPGSRVNTATHMVMGTTSHFSTYGVLASASVSAGDGFSCGVGTSGATACWGDNGVGQLGNGTTGSINATPGLVSAPAGVTFSAVSVGPAHACGLTSGGAAYCWGWNLFGELGNGTRTNSPVPTLVNAPGVAFGTVSMAENSSCATDGTGAVYCWGVDHGSILTTPQPISAPPGVTLFAVSIGGLFLPDSAVACGIAADGTPLCWGANGVGAVGNASSDFIEPAPVPLALPVTDSVFSAVSVGGKDYQFACGVGSTTGSVYCWGSNSNGQLGDGTATDSPTPVEVYAPGVSFSAVSAGRYHTCAVANAPPNTAYCWGANSSGQLGNGTTVDQLTPVAVSTIP